MAQDTQSRWADRVVRIERAAFWLTVLVTGATFWIAHRPPMADLPQHAAQIALWRDLLRGTSKWQSLFYVNYFTPYLVGSFLALLLSFVMPVLAALKLLLALTYVAFVAACVRLRRGMAGDARLDWLFVPGFFGLAYAWGFFPFLIALPLGVLFMALAQAYAERPAPGRGALLCAVGVLLFFSHALVFLFANAVGAVFLLLQRRSFRLLIASALPYAALGVLCVAYFLLSLSHAGTAPAELAGLEWPGPVSALKYLLFFPLSVPSSDWLYAALVPLLLIAPLALGYRPHWRNGAALVPLALLLVWLAVVPDIWKETFFIASRFAVFFLPFYALLFSAPPAGAPTRPSWMRLALPALCWIFLVVHAERLIAFDRESRSFEQALAAAEPGQRAKAMVLDNTSAAARSLIAYAHYPLWYQAEKSGLVDFNFAFFASNIVRYRSGKAPTERYRYFFVRSIAPLPDALFPADGCTPVLVKSFGAWSVFENVKC